MVDSYNGELKLACDGANNSGALVRILQYVEDSVDYGKCMNADERNLLRRNIQLSLSKLQDQPYTPKMVFNNFDIECLIGFGTFGRIWKAGGKYTGPVAIKQLEATMFGIPGIWKERDVMIAVKHPRICNILGAFHHHDAFIIMELCYGSIATLRNKITKKNAIRFSVHLLEAVAFIHSKNIIHADLKPDNCLIKTGNTLVVTDFGSAIVFAENEQEYVAKESSHGSPGYQDLPALRNYHFSRASDVFSAGCIIFEMDTKGTLLLYSNRPSHPRYLYIDALENGRVIGLPPNLEPSSDMDREDITERSLLSDFGFLVQKLVSSEHRVTADQALVDPSLRIILAESGVSTNTVSKDNEYVTREYNIDTSTAFSFFSDEVLDGEETAFLTFYYDEQDAALKPASPEQPPTTVSTPSSTESSPQPASQRKRPRVTSNTP